MIRRLVAVGLGLLFVALTAMARADEADAARRQVLVLLRLPPAHFRPDSQYAGGAYFGTAGRGARQAIASELARRHGLTLVTDWPLPALGVDCYVLGVPSERAPTEVVAALESDARVVWAQAMNVYRGQGASHADPLYAVQPAAAAWRLAELHAVATGRGVRVAVIDSGVDVRHPDLAGQVAAVENFVDAPPFAAERHGSAVAGIIAARADDHVGIVGVAPGARLLGLRGCWQSQDEATLCTSLGLAKALQSALGADAAVVNLSLSGPRDRLVGELIDVALRRRIAVVAAVDPALEGGGFPASHPGVVAVTDGHFPGAVGAPGRDVPAPVPGGRWELASGASYAAAHVAGLFALLRERGAQAAFGASALVLRSDGGIDACASVLRLAGPPGCAGDAASVAAAAPAMPP